ncbi:MAG: 4Fe-4S dicluster domain-containing protein [Candidatus Asgardarchaeia archaeon]
MKVYKMEKEKIEVFFDYLVADREVWGPVKKGEHHSFEKVQKFTDMDLDYTRTLLPPKKILLPPKFATFKFTETEIDAVIPDEKICKVDKFSALRNVPCRVIFGVHPCDIHGISILDTFFSLDYPDPYYLERRKNTIIIGYSCLPDENCFCKSRGTDTVQEGFDLFFTDLSDYYLVWVGSSIGDDLIKALPELFDENITNEDIRRYINWRKQRDRMFKLHIDFASMPDIIELLYNSDIWNEFGEKCLSCGSCSMVCPTCNCFNVVDVINIKNDGGYRLRHWDSCTLKEYSMVAGGHNFREARGERLKLWYSHKLRAFKGHLNRPSCVGCGRCIVTCPANINVKTVSERLYKEVGFNNG